MKVSKLKARDVMKTRVMAATRKAVGRDLAVQFLSGVYSGVPVIESTGELVGVVTEFDLLKAILEGKDLQAVKAEDLMSKAPISVEEDTPLEEVIRAMIQGHVLRIPVIRNRKLLGIISRSDLLDHLIDPHLVSVTGSA